MLHSVLAFSIQWDPGLRGVLVLVVGITVLPGSVYLLLSTNLGSRLGFLVAIAGLSGWLALMGFIWTMYGIGYKGTAPSWKVEEVVTSQSRDDLSAAKLDKAHDLSKWRALPADDRARGEAVAAATAALTTKGSPVQLFTAESDYKVVEVYTRGGKKVSKGIKLTRPFGDKGFRGFLNAWLPGPHPPHYTIVQVQPVIAQDVPLGQAPPTPKVDTSKPVESVILVRDLGKLRVPAFMVMLSSLIVFGISCTTLHRRDKAVMAARAAAAVSS